MKREHDGPASATAPTRSVTPASHPKVAAPVTTGRAWSVVREEYRSISEPRNSASAELPSRNEELSPQTPVTSVIWMIGSTEYCECAASAQGYPRKPIERRNSKSVKRERKDEHPREPDAPVEQEHEGVKIAVVDEEEEHGDLQRDEAEGPSQ